MFNFIGRLFASSPGPTRGIRLGVESLEGRDCPAVVGGFDDSPPAAPVPLAPPASQPELVQGREAARRAQCANNLKQFGASLAGVVRAAVTAAQPPSSPGVTLVKLR